MRVLSVAFLGLFPLVAGAPAQEVEPFDYCECESQYQLPLATMAKERDTKEVMARPGDCGEGIERYHYFARESIDAPDAVYKHLDTDERDCKQGDGSED